MKAIKLIILLLVLVSINSTNFGETTVKLTKLSGGTATIKIFTENSGTTAGSDLTISNMKLICDLKIYKLTCISSVQVSLSSEGTEIQCSIEASISTSSQCALFGTPTIQSTGDTYTAKSENMCTVEESKFGDTQIGLVSVEGKKTIIKIYPQRTGLTTTDGLFIQDLTVNNKALTCQAGKILTLEANTGTELECSTTEEIDGNIECRLGGNPKIFSKDDAFDDISYKTTKVYSSFGKVKVGLVAAKGTSVTIEFIPEYKGSIKVDVSGLKINGTRVLDCPETELKLVKEGIQLECTIAQGVEENDLCVLTETNLNSKALPKLEINEEKKTCVARVSKYGKVQISLKSVYGKQVQIIIKTTYGGPTESNKFTAEGLKLHCDNTDYTMTCTKSSKVTFSDAGTDFDCTINTKINGGKECDLRGTPSFISEGDTFSDIKVLNNPVHSSFGQITISLVSIIGREVKIKLTSEITGTTTSSIISINSIKLNDKDLTCPIGVNINFSDKPEFTCTLAELMNGNVETQLRGDNPILEKPENSKDIFGKITLSTSKVTSLFGRLEINLVSVTGNQVVISLLSEYEGNIVGLNVNSLYLNGNPISCKSSGVSLTLRDSSGSSNANIDCSFNAASYSQETNTDCLLTGTPSVSKKLFTTQVINNNKVTSGVRNFGETIIYLSSIKGTTVNIQIKPSLNGKVRPIISNLKLRGGEEAYDVKCDVADKKQLSKSSKTTIKCYIPRAISTATQCNLVNEGVNITSDSGDIFGNVVISTETVNIKPTASSFGDTQIKLTSIVGTQVNINIQVSQTNVYNYASPVIHNLYLGSSELYCVSSQALHFVDNIAQMSCTSPTAITCTNCQLTGTPTIVSLEDQEATFGSALIETKTVQATTSTLGNISIKLKEVIGNVVYIGVASTHNAKSSQQVDISNLYIDGQQLNCSDNFQFSTEETKVKCTVKEAIPYNKEVTLTGTPSIKINSATESVDVVELSASETNVITKSNSALNLELLSVKENFATISITATGLSKKTVFNNFAVIGLAINDIPFEINLNEVSLSSNPYTVRVKLNDTVERDTPCSLKGISTAQITADETTFGPITTPSNNIVPSSSFKFGHGTISLLYVQGYSVILRISTTKRDYTKNTEINDLYLNNNIPLTCKLKDDIEFSTYETDVECKLLTPMSPDTEVALSYKGEGDENFESIIVVNNGYRIYSTYKDFGEVTIGLKEVNGKNVKILVKTAIQNTTTTNNVQIKNLYVNGKEIICQFNEYIEFVLSGTILDCKLEASDSNETFTLTGREVEIISFADNFGYVTIDYRNNTVRTSPKDIEDLTISLSSVAGNNVNIKLTTLHELYTYLKISNLKIKNNEYSNTYNLYCPKVYINLVEKDYFSEIIKCELSTKLSSGLSLSLEDNRKEIRIESYDNFEEIIIETNEITSTKFGDMSIIYISSSVVIGLYPLYQDRTYSSININNIKLNSSFVLDCGTNESIELKESGTMLYCTLKGTNTVEGVNNKPPFIEAGSIEDTFGNIFLEYKPLNLKSPNCYAIYDKASCEVNHNCVFSKDYYGFCDNKNNLLSNTSEILYESNECYLYLNEEGCNNNDNCEWNIENKYSCKTKEIQNCKKLNNDNLCEECDLGYELNSESTKCISTNDTVYPCREYSSYSTCTSKPQCEYLYESYEYCSLKDYEEFEDYDDDCYLYITKDSCNSVKKCTWSSSYYSGCREKFIDNCLKLRESDPTSCEQCEEGYYSLLGKMCTKESQSIKEQCDKFVDDEESCESLEFCEFTSRAYCYGEGENCHLYLDQNMCQNNDLCHWNPGNWDKCQIKNISNCLLLSSQDSTTCSLCKDGYYLSNYNTSCIKRENTTYKYYTCYEHSYDLCNLDDRCEYTKRNFCLSYGEYYDSYNFKQCLTYLDKEQCESYGECYWTEYEDEISCQFKSIDNCLKLNYEDTSKCEQCKSGYELANESTECKSSSLSQIINVSLVTFALILLLF